jgi:enoyl-CoA hydratase
LKVASRTRSGVGRVLDPSGATRRLPRADPETTRTGATVQGAGYGPAMSDIELPDGVVVVRIDQGHVRNAVNTETAQRLHDAFVAFDGDDSARVAVLTGDAQAFSAGANLRDLPKMRDSGPLGPTRLQLAKPVIAAIEGWCVAGGVELAAWCDLRVAGQSARIGCLERRWGVPLIDGGTYRLPQIVGLGRALDLILTGREIGAEEAERMGFVNRVVPDGQALATAIELAGEIASYPWLGVVNDRRSVYAGLGRDLHDALAIEDELGRETIFADGFREGVARFDEHQAARER